MSRRKGKKETLASLPLSEHLKELRQRLLCCLAFFAVASALCWFARDTLYNIITYPLIRAMQANHIPASLIYTRLTEAFTSTLSVVASSALLLSLPYFTLQAWLFIIPALYKEEKKHLMPYILATPALFALGAAFCYFLVLPAAFGFLVGFSEDARLSAPLILQARIAEYIDLTASLLSAFGLCFLSPVFLLLLARFGIISADMMKRGRKYAVILIFVIAAALTPPDVASQVMLALPLMAMYEISAFLVARRERKP